MSHGVRAVRAAVLASLLACAHTPPAPASVQSRPSNFVSIADVDPTILVELRYFGDHNFLGRRVDGYERELCLLTDAAAAALRKVQDDVRRFGFTVKLYDCYRPQRAVDSFIAWAKDPHDRKMQAEFFPRVPKERLFAEGYVAERSGHSRGSTVDVTLVPVPPPAQERYVAGAPLRDCALPKDQRFGDNSLDFGAGYDCFDPVSNLENPAIPLDARVRRLMLRAIMEKHGFTPALSEWWHYTLANEPYPETYFDFPIE